VFEPRTNDQRVGHSEYQALVDLHPDLIRQLNQLSEALDDGTDLHAVLAVLADDLLAVMPGFLGLELTLAEANTPLTLTTLTAGTSTAVRASLLLPLARMGWTTEANSTLIYYADTPHAFAALAADVRATFDLDGQVVVDQHLEPATSPPSFTDLDDLSTLNQAIGILIGRGDLTLEEAHRELHRLATENHLPPLDIAHRLIAEPDAFG